MPLPLSFEPAPLATLVDAAESAYPREACGLLLGHADKAGERCLVLKVHAAQNLATEADRFELDPAAIVKAEDLARSQGLELLGVWHSHPDAGAEPSAADRKGAFAGWYHVIQAVRAGRAEELRVWSVPGREESE